MNRFGLLCLLATIVSVFTANADIPSNYYISLDGKASAELKTAVCNVVNTLPKRTTSETDKYYYNMLPVYFRSTDTRPNTNPQQWWDMYSNMPFYVSNGMAGLNREHSFPKSWWGGGMDTPAYVDLNHLYPAEAKANQAKSNYPLGEVSTVKVSFNNGVSKVGYPVSGQGGGAAYVFEPADEYKGDFARTYFYMVTCYQGLTWRYNWMLVQNTYPTLTTWAQELLLKWATNDPVSQKEINRNEAVYAAQGNRNPFIDFPQLAEYIWGTKRGEVFHVDDSGNGDPSLLFPVNKSALDFGETAINRNMTAELRMKGENLRGNLTISIFGENASFFKSNVTRVPASGVNGNDGYNLSITYTPTTEGVHSATLAISDGGMEGSVIIYLKGQAFPTPTLSAPVATAASDVTSTSYTANWEVPEGEVIDYYIVTRTVYDNGNQTTRTYDAESNSYWFDDMLSGTTESYYVQSVRLGYKSQPSNVINVSPGSVTGVSVDNGMTVHSGNEGDILLRTTARHTDCHIYDMQGREVLYLPIVEGETVVTLPQGVYLIRSAEMSHPVKAVSQYR